MYGLPISRKLIRKDEKFASIFNLQQKKIKFIN